MNIGTLEIELLANVARLRQDMTAATGAVGSGVKEIQNLANQAKTALGAIGVSLTAGAFASWIKGAIDAGDATKQMAEKTGLAAEEVAGVELAFKQAGIGGDAMTTSMGKMAKQMVEGNKAFDDLGIKTRNTDGTMRNTKDVLYDVADAFKDVEGGAAKSALAQEIFGKSGADMLPLLNGGAEGMREMAEMAQKLGLVIDQDAAEASDKFNDTVELLGMGLQGVARQTTAQLLPTLNNLTGAMLETMTQGDGLRKVADALAAGLKFLFSAGVVVVEVFNTIGKTIGAAGAQVVAVMQGDFKGAAQIGQEYAKDVKSGWSDTATTLAKVWSDSGNKTVESLAGITSAQRKLAVQSKEEAAEAKKLAEQKAALMKKEAEEYAKLIEKMTDRSQSLDLEFAKGEKLTESEKQAIEIKRKYTGAERDQALALNDSNVVKEERNRLDELGKKWAIEATAAVRANQTAIEAQTSALVEEVEKQRQANEAIGKTAEQLAVLERARIEERAAGLEANATWLESVGLAGLETAEFRKQAAELRKLADLKGQGIHIKAAVDSAEAWKKTTDEIGAGLTDSLFRAFESGKDFFSTFWSGIKNLFKTTVLKLLIQPVQGAMNSIVGSVLGGASGLAQAGGLGGGLGGLGSLGGLAGIGASLGAFGTAAGYGASALFGGTGLTALSGGMSMVGAGSVASGLGMMAGVLGPIALGVGAIMAILKSDTSGTPHSGGTAYADRLGSGLTDGRDINFDTEASYNTKIQTSVLQTSKSVADILNAFASVTGGANYRVSTGFQDDTSKDGAWGGLAISKDGQKVLDWRDSQTSRWAPKEFADGEQGWKDYMAAIAASTKDAIGSIGLPEWAKATLDALGGAPTLEELAKAADTIAQTQGTIKALGEQFAPLGGVFAKISGLSSDATMQLAQFAGGIDALIAKTQAYVQGYYSDSEQISIQASAVKRALVAAGFTGDLSKKDEFRALVDARAGDVDTEAGRKQLAALLDVATSFAGVADYIAKNGGTLDSLAATAPQVQILQQQLDQQTAQVNATQQTVSAINTVNTSIDGMRQAVVSSIESLGVNIGGIAEAVERSSRSMADALFERATAGVEP